MLPDRVAQPPGTVERIARDGQIRLWWNETPVDLFFDDRRWERLEAAEREAGGRRG